MTKILNELLVENGFFLLSFAKVSDLPKQIADEFKSLQQHEPVMTWGRGNKSNNKIWVVVICDNKAYLFRGFDATWDFVAWNKIHGQHGQPDSLLTAFNTCAVWYQERQT